LAPTIAELRKKTQDRPDKHDFYMWAVMRKISVYVTWLFTMTPMTPNQVTILSMAFGIAGACFFLSSNPMMWVFGWIVLQINLLLDQVDGELARYKNKQTMFGYMLDEINHPITNIAVFSAMTIGIYTLVNSQAFLILGILSVLGISATRIAGVYESYVQSTMFKIADRKVNTPTDVAGIIKSIPTGLGGYLHIAVAPALMDMVFSSLGIGFAFALGPITVANFREAFMIVFGILFPAAFFSKVIRLRSELKDTKI
jgi:phosphatidylglycerophosphate synthase